MEPFAAEGLRERFPAGACALQGVCLISEGFRAERLTWLGFGVPHLLAFVGMRIGEWGLVRTDQADSGIVRLEREGGQAIRPYRPRRLEESRAPRERLSSGGAHPYRRCPMRRIRTLGIYLAWKDDLIYDRGGGRSTAHKRV
ncbi:hypothetical protein [Thermoflexus sp.]|uniref:hypothetical protein n=1 Tax=Thermoflexus sp. TaxID=1969742 RepID=UPI0035E44FA4